MNSCQTLVFLAIYAENLNEKVESLRKHYYRKHQDVIVDQNHENDQNDVDIADDIENKQVDHEETTLVCLDEGLKGLQKHITLFDKSKFDKFDKIVWYCRYH